MKNLLVWLGAGSFLQFSALLIFGGVDMAVTAAIALVFSAVIVIMFKACFDAIRSERTRN